MSDIISLVINRERDNLEKLSKLRAQLTAAQAESEKLRNRILETQGQLLEQAKNIAREHYIDIEERWESDEAYGRYTALLDCSTALNRLLSLNTEDKR